MTSNGLEKNEKFYSSFPSTSKLLILDHNQPGKANFIVTEKSIKNYWSGLRAEWILNVSRLKFQRLY